MDKVNNKILNCKDKNIESLNIEICEIPEDDDLLNFYEGKFNSSNRRIGQALVKYSVHIEGKFINEPTDVKFVFTYIDLNNKENTLETIISYDFNPVEFSDFSLRLRVEYVELLALTVESIFDNALEEYLGDKNNA